MGPGWPRLSSRSPQPSWKTATSTPKEEEEAAASRFITAATAGISRLRKASMSSRNPRMRMNPDEDQQLGSDDGGEAAC
jgi:hypothetical protein